MLLELVDSDVVLCSTTIDGTFRWFQTVGGLYQGECVFSGYLDLTNPITIQTEKLSLRLSIIVPLSVASASELRQAGLIADDTTSGYCNLIYEKEVK